MACPCHTVYHVRCFQAGPPFTTRLRDNKGLVLPTLSIWPRFVCELCTVRATIGRELGCKGDRWLLQLERMRVLDMMHHWASSTMGQYQSKLRAVRRFEQAHPGLNVLVSPPLSSPPCGPGIGAMWMELHASVQPSRRRGRRYGEFPSYGTVRQYRSAASQFLGWDEATRSPDRSYFMHSTLLSGPVRSTDSAAYTYFARGLSVRMGDRSVPATALLHRHVQGLDMWFESLYHGAPPGGTRLSHAQAGLTNILLWLSWLRGGELFDIQWKDVDLIWPGEGGSLDLPLDLGAVLLRLRPETKSSRTRTADLAICMTTALGLDLGKWVRRALHETPDQAPHSPLFLPIGGSRWDSRYYRTNYLYPGLTFLWAGGDSFLQAFDDTPGNSIPEKFYSLHCYRRELGPTASDRTLPQGTAKPPGSRSSNMADGACPPLPSRWTPYIVNGPFTSASQSLVGVTNRGVLLI